jgi:hypothetical protein
LFWFLSSLPTPKLLLWFYLVWVGAAATSNQKPTLSIGRVLKLGRERWFRKSQMGCWWWVVWWCAKSLGFGGHVSICLRMYHNAMTSNYFFLSFQGRNNERRDSDFWLMTWVFLIL